MTQSERFRFILGMPLVMATSYYAPLTAALVTAGIQNSTIRSGWGADAQSGATVFLEIEFTMPKNSLSDDQARSLGAQLALITNTPLHEVNKQDVADITVP